MSEMNYDREALAHYLVQERIARASEPRLPAGSTVRVPEPRRRRALARQFRRIADALDN